ncbi:Auxin efflux carrier family protein [Entamoeba marina]
MKVLFNLALPSVIFLNLFKKTTFDIDSIYLVSLGIAYQVGAVIISSLVFICIKDPSIRKLSVFNSFALNTALFIFPLMSSIADDGVSKTILFCFANDCCCYAILRPLYAVLGSSQHNEDDSIPELEDIEIGIEMIKNNQEHDNNHVEIKKSTLKVNSEDDFTNTNDDIHENDINTSLKQSKDLSQNKSSTSNDIMSSYQHNDDYASKKVNSLNKQKLTTKQQYKKKLIHFGKILLETLHSIITSIPIYALVFGYLSVVIKPNLPSIITSSLTVCSQANTLLAYAVLGTYFDWKIPKRLIFATFRVVSFRIIYGLAFGLAAYFSLKGLVEDVTRFVILVSPLTPPPLVNTIYVVEYDIKPAELPVVINNINIILSFIVILVVTGIVNPEF